MSATNFTPEKVVFCYRDGDADSLSVAQYYQTQRKIPEVNLIALPCSTDQTIEEAEYESQIESPLIDALDALDDIWCIVLGYHVPNFYTVDSERIPIACRVQRLRQSRSKTSNHFFNQQSFEFLTTEDIAEFYVTSVLDGPDVSAAQLMIDQSIAAENSGVLTGKVYLDPYGLRLSSEQLEYRDDLVEFEYNYLPYLGLNYNVTVESSFDPTFKSFNGDAFYWGWYTPYCPVTLFSNQNQVRVFLYNADGSSAANPRSDVTTGSLPWCNVSQVISPPYASTAGSADDPGIDAYLQPEPFFRALHLGATLGEAFMAASKYIDWRIFLIGDPLMIVSFPGLAPLGSYPPASSAPLGNVPSVVDGTLLDSSQVSQSIKDKIEDAIAFRDRAYHILETTSEYTLTQGGLDETLYLLEPMVKWKDDLNRQKDLFKRAISKWSIFTIESNRLPIDDWFNANSQLTTTPFYDAVNSTIGIALSSSYVYPDDQYWIMTFYYVHSIKTAEKVHFQLQIQDYYTGTVIHEANSIDSSNGWEYEFRTNIFVDMTDGFLSRNSGRRVRYVSPIPNYTSSQGVYQPRWRALHESGTPITDWIDMTDPMIVKGQSWDVDITEPDSIVFYANAFGSCLQSAQWALAAVKASINYIKNVSTSSMPVYNLVTHQENRGFYPLQQRNELIAALRDLQVTLNLSTYTRRHYPKVFQSLYAYVESAYGQDIDSYLSFYGLKVNKTFALVSESLGVTISDGNIGDV